MNLKLEENLPISVYWIAIVLLAARRVIAIPTFQETSYETHSDENTPVDTLITQLQAFDTQGGDPSQISYSIEDNPWFKINATGFVKVKSIIDAEDSAVQNVMTYIVTANNPSGSGTTTLSVIINDINESSPRWVRRVFTTDIFEGDTPGTSIVNLTATDRDRDANLTFRLITDFPYFDVNAFTGEITVNQTVDMADIVTRQKKNPFLLQVAVSDGKYVSIGLVQTNVYASRSGTPLQNDTLAVNTTPTATSSGTDEHDKPLSRCCNCNIDHRVQVILSGVLRHPFYLIALLSLDLPLCSPTITLSDTGQ